MKCPKCGLHIDGENGRCPFCQPGPETPAPGEGGKSSQKSSPIFLILGLGGAVLAAVTAVSVCIFAWFMILVPMYTDEMQSQEYSDTEPLYGPFAPVTVASGPIFSRDGISVSVQELIPDGQWGPELVLSLSNESGRSAALSVSAVSVNGFMNPVYFQQEIPDGGSVSSTLSLDGWSLDLCGISVLREIEIQFALMGEDSAAPLWQSDPVLICTEGTDDFPESEESPARLLFEENGIRAFLLPIPPDSPLWQEDGPLMLVENRTDRPITFQAVHVMADGASTPASLYLTILPGKKAVEQLFLTELFLQEGSRVSAAFDVFDSATGERILQTDLLNLNAPAAEENPFA